jgi:predicted nucleic acid-binding protein
MIAYIDTSVLVRIVFGEPNPLAEWRDIRIMASSALIEIEFARALDNKRMQRRLATGTVGEYRSAALGIIGEMAVIDLDRSILRRATEPFAVPIGTLDAIHLATALRFFGDEFEDADEPLVLATHDENLAAVARAHALEVIGA